MSYQLNARQREEVYKKCELIYPEVCSYCQKTLKECKMNKFYLHHTRYDVDPKDPEYIRFMCNSCNKLQLFSRYTIEEYCLKNPLGKRPYNESPITPRTFAKGELIEKRLRQYLPRRLAEERERMINEGMTGREKLLFEAFRADSCEYCGCLPTAIDQHIIPLCSPTEGKYKLFDDSEGKEWITWNDQIFEAYNN